MKYMNDMYKLRIKIISSSLWRQKVDTAAPATLFKLENMTNPADFTQC